MAKEKIESASASAKKPDEKAKDKPEDDCTHMNGQKGAGTARNPQMGHNLNPIFRPQCLFPGLWFHFVVVMDDFQPHFS